MDDREVLGPAGRVTVSGTVCHKGVTVAWEFYFFSMAVIVNGRGDLILSCQEDVLEISMRSLRCRPRPWEDDRPTKVEVFGREALVRTLVKHL